MGDWRKKLSRLSFDDGLGLFFLMGILELVELVIMAMFGEELLMGSFFEDFAILQDDDLIRVLDGGKTVGDDKHGADGTDALQGILDEQFGFSVDVGRGFVENKNLRLM